jgi:hypothetical protein
LPGPQDGDRIAVLPAPVDRLASILEPGQPKDDRETQ